MKFEPLYLQMKERLREDLLGTQESERLPTLDELQVRYGVSRPTISKALTALVAEGLLIKERGRGGFALASASSHKASLEPSRLTIGFISPLSTAELPQNAFRGIDRVAHRSDCRVLMAGSGDSVAQERIAALEMIAAGARGLIIYPTLRRGDSGTHDYLMHEDLGVPIVLVDTCTPEQGHPQVVFDNQRAGYQMTRWLIDRGSARIGLIFYLEDTHHPALDARYRGYVKALRDHSLPLDPTLVRRVEPNNLIPALEETLTELLALPHPPAAIMASDDMMAIEIIEILSHRGVHVPEEIYVAGFDNSMAARRYQPAFTTTNPDFETLGEVACETLLDRIETGERTAQIYMLPVPLLARKNLIRGGGGGTMEFNHFGQRKTQPLTNDLAKDHP